MRYIDTSLKNVHHNTFLKLLLLFYLISNLFILAKLTYINFYPLLFFFIIVLLNIITFLIIILK